eukprot:CFRG0051T1
MWKHVHMLQCRADLTCQYRRGLKRAFHSNRVNSTKTSDNNKYSDTVLLPRTNFPQRADAVNREAQIQDRCVTGLYEWQQRYNTGDEFVLHDGPPYANGPLHLGHALNKISKDIVNRYKVMTNHRVTYIPGWDCHGLPIELKAMEAKKKSNKKAKVKTDMSPMAIRSTARELAASTVISQTEGFKRWGILGEWDNPYKTMEPAYVDQQISVFAEMFRKGYIYRAYKPVFWSPSSRTALAEAELEYVDDHVSQSIYVKLPLVKNPPLIQRKGSNELSSLLVWTTTPWTLPANKAVCVSPTMQYSLLTWATHNCWVATSRVEAVVEALGINENEYKVKEQCSGSELIGSTYEHPLLPNVECCVLAAGHVTDDSGSGLVHTAPAHGVDDFVVCDDNNIAIDEEMVDAAGRFTENAGKDLQGLNIHKDGTDVVLAKLKESNLLLAQAPYKHRYPYDWRTKKPVILRATKQWFGRVHSGLGDLALSLLNSTKVPIHFFPPSGLTRLTAMIASRRDWCLSRQRVWGVPIPVFYSETTGEAVMETEIVEHVRELIRTRGTDCWFELCADDLLPQSYRGKGLVKGTDTMDVWFDSGSSWASVLKQKNKERVADLYLEGSDQHRGWFQSSLLISAAVEGKSPFKTVLTHGFVLDEKSKKMSKSIGNVISPEVVVEGGTLGGKSVPAGGADALRMWVASSDSTGDVSVGASVLSQSLRQLKKLRNTSRFILGNLGDFNADRDSVQYDQMMDVDKYMLSRLIAFADEVTAHYDSYAFHRVSQTTMKFVNLELSAFYFDVIKDRLYTDAHDGKRRRSAQTALYHILSVLTRSFAPILPHLADEVWQHNISSSVYNQSIFKSGWVVTNPEWNQPQLSKRWAVVNALTTHINRSLEMMRKDSLIGSALDAAVTINGPSSLMKLLRMCNDGELMGTASHFSSLNDAFLVSSTTLWTDEDGTGSIAQELTEPKENVGQSSTVDLSDLDSSLVGTCTINVCVAEAGTTDVENIARLALSKCKRCWKVAAGKDSDVCSRCSDVLSRQWWCPKH